MGETNSKVAFELCVSTEDYQGNNLGPSVNMVMFDTNNAQSPTIALANLFQNEVDFRQAKFTIDLQPWSKPKIFGRLHHIEFWRTDGGPFASPWFLDRVVIRDRRHGLTGEWDYFFLPVHDWILPDAQYVVHDCETFLPQDEPFPELRDAQLARRQQLLTFTQRAKGLPVEILEVPTTELFSYDAKWNIEELVLELIEQSGLSEEYSSEEPWDSLDSLGALYKQHNITEPLSLSYWMVNDVAFGAQRLKGCNPFVIQLCTQLPPSLECLRDWIKPHLEGWTLQQTIAAKRLYIVDFAIMRGLHCRPGRVIAAPLALFFYTEKRQLQPLAIHMDADSSDRRQLFLFTDSSEDWLQAKLWFNLADACHHMIAGRLLTHLLLESIYVSMRRNLAQSHPIYQLMAPHFRSLLAVNSKLKDWIFDKGWIARNIQLSKKGIRQLLKRAFKQWRFDVKANVYAECESRGVYDRKGLGNYPYRDDAFLVYGIFDRFIVKFLRIFYPRGPVDLLEDVELQSWRKELSDPMEDGGLGLEGIPCGKARIRNGVVRPVGKNYSSSDSMISDTSADFVYGLTTIEETKSFVLGIIHLLVIVAGSALRLPMFDEYGFTPHYPLSLFGQPPFHTDFDERGRRMNGSSVSGISSSSGLDRTIAALPNQRMTVEMVLFTRICSRVRQSVLGKYDSNFILDPRAVPLQEEFQKNLEDASRQVAAHNRMRDLHHKYFALDPLVMPNFPGI
ncbi:hypothetical protein AAHC03_09266 [Spirometra sp. Aus1]